jgi:CheY-like chemotaxis protein
MSKKLLLADDSITIQKVIGITFANEDYALSVVDNGDAALERARVEQPDLILADVFMPGKNGYELCAAVKAEASLRHIPVLLLAGTFEPFDEAKARKAGAEGWIAKPFESQALIDRVEELLARAQAAAAARPSAPAESPPVAAVASAPVTAVEEEDSEPDLWAELGPVVAPTVDVAEPIPGVETPGETAVETIDGAGIDDLWGEVSLGADDLGPVAATEAPADIWQDLEVPAPASPRTAAAEPVRVDDGNLWDEIAASAEPDSGASVPAEAFAAAEEEEEVFLILDDEESAELLEPSADGAEEDEAFIFVEDDALAQDLSEAAAQPLEAAATFLAAEPAEEELLELDEGDILPLDDGDILVEDELELLEEGLELLEPEEVVGGVEDSPADWVAEEVPAPEEAFDDLLIIDLPQEPAASETRQDFPEAAPAAEESSLLVDGEMEESPLWDIEEPVLASAPAPDVAVENLFEPESVAEVAAPAPPAPPAAPAPVVLAAAAAEAQVQGLSEAELTRIVERVAGEVIEKLAGTILERLAWEVVPDLAESLIREEIRKIRDNVA